MIELVVTRVRVIDNHNRLSSYQTNIRIKDAKELDKFREELLEPDNQFVFFDSSQMYFLPEKIKSLNKS